MFENHLSDSNKQTMIKNVIKYGRAMSTEKNLDGPRDNQTQDRAGNFMPLLQQLTFELNKSTVLTARLSKSKDQLKIKDSEL